MNETALNLMGIFLESAPSNPRMDAFTDYLTNLLTADHDSHFASHVIEIMNEAEFDEKCRVFAAGMKAGMEIAAFYQKGA